MINLYEVLNVSPHATADEIKSAYRERARETHPDHQGSAEQFRAIQEAYSVLGDPERRAQYDARRREWMRTIGAVECHGCGAVNRIIRRPGAGEIVRCRVCKLQLRLTLGDLLQVQRQALVSETARLVDEVGADLASLAADSVRAGLGRLRRRLGLSVKGTNKT
jgi:curved DNA-binding protein CbpA